MQLKTILLLLVILNASLVYADPPTSQPSRVVGVVDGRSITAADLKISELVDQPIIFSPGDPQQALVAMRITWRFGQPIYDHFAKEQKIEVTTDEIAVYQQAQRISMQKQIAEMELQQNNNIKKLAAGGLSDGQRDNIRSEMEQIASRLSDFQRALKNLENEAQVKNTILDDKLRKAIWAKYGNLIPKNFKGIDSMEAKRLFFERAETEGLLKFDDPNVRLIFYKALNPSAH